MVEILYCDDDNKSFESKFWFGLAKKDFMGMKHKGKYDNWYKFICFTKFLCYIINLPIYLFQ